jgi:uncharacterized protein (TIGR02266 family)
MSDPDEEGEEGGTVVDFDPSNRRSEPRFEAELRVEYHSLDDFVVAYTEDISRGGVFVATDNLLAIGSVVRLNLALPNDGPTVHIIARVAYVLGPQPPESPKRSGMGMEFLDVEGGPLADQLEAFLTLRFGEEQRPRAAVAADILLVDLDESHRQRCHLLLRKLGHRISTASSGIEALGLILRVPPDLVIADVELPTMDGWRLLRMVRERPSIAQLPFVLLSPRDDEAVRLRGYQAGVDELLIKPVASDDFIARIDRVLARAQAPRRPNTRNALRGDLEQVQLASVLAFIEAERRTGQMLVVRGETVATLYIKDGEVIHVDMPSQRDQEGLDRLFAVLDWREGQFELTAMDVNAPRSITMSTGHAIMEHARRSDEAER